MLVVGGGVVGASIAFHLARRGAAVTVLEAGDRPRGATARSAAQVRMHHSDRHDALLAARSLPTFERWAEEVGGDCGFRQVGFAFLAGADRRAAVTTMAATVRGYGVATEVLGLEQYAADQPELSLDGVGVVAYEARGGFADPRRTTGSLLAAAVRHGARVVHGTTALSLSLAGDRVTGVHTATGRHSAGQVVVASGTRSAPLCRSAGARLPVRARRIGYAVTGGPAAVPHVLIDDTIAMYARPVPAGGVWFGVPLDQPDPAAQPAAGRPEPASVAAARHRLTRRIPALAGVPVVRAAAALEAYTEDRHALIGPAGEPASLYLCTAFSGGGFKVAPAVGGAVAEELVTGEPRPELEPYRPDRFGRGAPIRPDVDYRCM